MKKFYKRSRRDVHKWRDALDLLLTDCGRYFRKNDKERYALKCATLDCGCSVAEQLKRPCTLRISEENLLLRLLQGSGLTDKYQPKPRHPSIHKAKAPRVRILRNLGPRKN